MLSQRVLARALGVDAKSVRLEGVELVDDRVLIRCRPRIRHRWRCPHCERRCPGYDRGRERRWRALDFGRTYVFIAATVPRVECTEHGVVTAAVPWARHAARHTIAFEQLAAWCAVEMSKSVELVDLPWGKRPVDLAQGRSSGEDSDQDHHRNVTLQPASRRRSPLHASSEWGPKRSHEVAGLIHHAPEPMFNGRALDRC